MSDNIGKILLNAKIQTIYYAILIFVFSLTDSGGLFVTIISTSIGIIYLIRGFYASSVLTFSSVPLYVAYVMSTSNEDGKVLIFSFIWITLSFSAFFMVVFGKKDWSRLY